MEEIIRDTLDVYGYHVSDSCIAHMVELLELHLDSVGWTAVE